MKKGYIIAHLDITDQVSYDKYLEKIPPILEAFRGRFIVRAGRTIVPENPMKERHVVMEFPSFTAANDAYLSEEFQSLSALRTQSASADIVIAEGT